MLPFFWKRGEPCHVGARLSQASTSTGPHALRARRHSVFLCSRWSHRTIAPAKLLVEELQRRGGHVEYETTFVSAVQHDDSVRVTLDQKGKTGELSAAFVVGCDGAHSAVRHLLDLPFEGAMYDALFLLADIQSNDKLPADQLQFCPNEVGPVAIFPMSATRRRIVAMIHQKEGDAPSLEMGN